MHDHVVNETRHSRVVAQSRQLEKNKSVGAVGAARSSTIVARPSSHVREH